MTCSIVRTIAPAWTSASAPRIFQARCGRRIALAATKYPIVKACAAVVGNDDKALDLLNDVAADARKRLGYTLCRIHWMVRHDRIEDAARLMQAAAPTDHAASGYRRMVARTACVSPASCSIVQFQDRLSGRARCRAAGQANITGRISISCPAGSRLRYLNDPATARQHFAHIDDGSANPIVLAQGELLARSRRRGRAKRRDARRLSGRRALSHRLLRTARTRQARPRENRAADAAGTRLTAVLRFGRTRARRRHALYARRARFVLSFVSDLAEESVDVAVLAALAS